MRLLRHCVFLAPLAVFCLPVAAHADATSSHLASLSWLNGTYRCANSGTIAGKQQKRTTSAFIVRRNGSWYDLTDPKDKVGLTRVTYSKMNGKYVYVSTNSDASYNVGYLNVTPSGFSVVYPSVVAVPMDDRNPSAILTRTANGYIFQSSGTAMSGKDKGKPYMYKSVCTK